MSGRRAGALLALALVAATALYLGARAVGRSAASPRPDLVFAGFVDADPLFPVPGQDARLRVPVENAGGGALETGVTVAAFASDPREGDAERVSEGRLEAPLAPGGRRTLSLPFVAPDTPQDVALFVALDPEGASRERASDRDDNVLSASVRVVAPRPPTPDLRVSELRFEPAAPRSDQDVAIRAVVENAGDGPTGGAAVLDLYVNDPIGPRPRLPGTRRLAVPPLEPGGSIELSARLRFEEALLVGVYAQVDTDLEIDELDETNNLIGPEIVAVGTAEQRGAPDLVVEALELDPPTPVLGEAARLRVSVANRGGADTATGFAVNVHYGPEGGSGAGFPARDDGPDWSRDVRFLAAGRSFRLPDVAVPFHRGGAWTVTAVVDAYHEVEEEDEANNRRELRLRVGPGR